jgi:hypothetical protein
MKWLGRQDSNLRYTGSKPDALPLGYAPVTIQHAAYSYSLATCTGTQAKPGQARVFCAAMKGVSIKPAYVQSESVVIVHLLMAMRNLTPRPASVILTGITNSSNSA